MIVPSYVGMPYFTKAYARVTRTRYLPPERFSPDARFCGVG